MSEADALVRAIRGWQTKTMAAAAVVLLVAVVVAMFLYRSASSLQPQAVSIAVLPFSSSSDRGGNDEYFVDGITDDTIASLS